MKLKNNFDFLISKKEVKKIKKKYKESKINSWYRDSETMYEIDLEKFKYKSKLIAIKRLIKILLNFWFLFSTNNIPAIEHTKAKNETIIRETCETSWTLIWTYTGFKIQRKGKIKLIIPLFLLNIYIDSFTQY